MGVEAAPGPIEERRQQQTNRNGDVERVDKRGAPRKLQSDRTEENRIGAEASRTDVNAAYLPGPVELFRGVMRKPEHGQRRED